MALPHLASTRQASCLNGSDAYWSCSNLVGLLGFVVHLVQDGVPTQAVRHVVTGRL